MQIGMIGLGKMGANMTTRLVNGGHHVVVTDWKLEAVEAGAAAGAVPAKSLDELVENLDAPRAVRVMVPSGAPTESVVNELTQRLDEDDPCSKRSPPPQTVVGVTSARAVPATS